MSQYRQPHNSRSERTNELPFERRAAQKAATERSSLKEASLKGASLKERFRYAQERAMDLSPSHRESRREEKRHATNQNAPYDQEIFNSLNSAFSRGIEGAKATFNRLVDHAKAFIAGIGVEIARIFIPSSDGITPGFGLLGSYLGLIMLFPSRPNRFALGVGIIAAIIMILSGYWPISLLIGGIVAAISGIRDRDINNRAFWFTIPLALLFLAGSLADHPAAAFSIFPGITSSALAVTLLFGLLAPKKIRRKFSYLFMSEREKQAYIETEREIEAELAALRRAEKLEAEKAAKYALFGRHIELLEKIEMLVDRLPQDIADQVVEIGFSASKIIKAMERDPRDVLVGGRFLNRYLPLIQENLQKYLTVMEYASRDKQIELHQEILRSMQTLQQAFDTLSDELIENDLHDLKVDTTVIDKLLRSQGFEVDRG